MVPGVLAVAAMGWVPAHAAPTEAPLQVPLECRLGQGLWRPCTMTIERVGQHWWLQVGQQRLEFRSNGRGSLTLKEPEGPVREVLPVWNSDRALCWDGVCAKGEFPLD